MSALIDSNPAYKAVTWFVVDWDVYGDDAIVTELEIPRRSTLVMFNEGKEIARVVAQTTAKQIEPMFAAATS